MIWVKFFKRFLGESDTFSQVLFIMFMDTCWFSSSEVEMIFFSGFRDLLRGERVLEYKGSAPHYNLFHHTEQSKS